ncbi:hypothetical protein [Pseudomonas zeae]|uniref:Uncharacterized protein n=1 Tax=Pseudomonas zeae TaxID=2745510 RepID=A0ABU5BSQ1_9PSED|nr:hypothetical protein [Pseudomonas zeae]MDX9679728.1 hypothetical protein [Pseudomonas zeae]
MLIQKPIRLPLRPAISQPMSEPAQPIKGLQAISTGLKRNIHVGGRYGV